MEGPYVLKPASRGKRKSAREKVTVNCAAPNVGHKLLGSITLWNIFRPMPTDACHQSKWRWGEKPSKSPASSFCLLQAMPAPLVSQIQRTFFEKPYR